MAIDILCAAFVLLLGMWGWKRGLVSQLVTIGSAVLLWLTRPLWEAPLSDVLSFGGQALAHNPFLRKITAFLLLYLVVVLVVVLIERKVIKRYGPLHWSNHWLGAILGTAKGLVYAVIILWFLEAGALWKLEPSEEPPGWLEDSATINLVGPWNPIRMFTLREVVDQMRLRSAKGQATGGQSSRTERLSESRPVRELVDEIENDESWHRRKYVELLRNPKVQKIVREPQLKVLLFGI